MKIEKAVARVDAMTAVWCSTADKELADWGGEAQWS